MRQPKTQVHIPMCIIGCSSKLRKLLTPICILIMDYIPMRREWMTNLRSGESSPYLSWLSINTDQLMDKFENYEWQCASTDEKLWRVPITLIPLDEQSITLSQITIHFPLACYVLAHNRPLIQKHKSYRNPSQCLNFHPWRHNIVQNDQIPCHVWIDCIWSITNWLATIMAHHPLSSRWLWAT